MTISCHPPNREEIIPMMTLMEEYLNLQHRCIHIIPCAVTAEMREHAATKLEEARVAGDDYKVLLAVAQLTGPCAVKCMDQAVLRILNG